MQILTRPAIVIRRGSWQLPLQCSAFASGTIAAGLLFYSVYRVFFRT